jgi:hypothetical protein
VVQPSRLLFAGATPTQQQQQQQQQPTTPNFKLDRALGTDFTSVGVDAERLPANLIDFFGQKD